MNTKVMQAVEQGSYKQRADVKPGDTVKLHMRISEGGKERIQVFKGLVISVRGVGMSKTITVRKISAGVGVERIVPLHAPTLDKLEIVKRGNVNRAKLYYLRTKVGKAAMKVKEKFGSDVVAVEEVVAEVAPEAEAVEVVETAAAQADEAAK